LRRLVFEPMDLEKKKVVRGDPVLSIYSAVCDDAVLCEFLGYAHGREGEAFFRTPFKVIFRTPVVIDGKTTDNIEVRTPKTFKNYCELMPTQADTVVVGMDMVLETLCRIGDYETYVNIAAELFGSLRTMR